jgi:hypothetical protein
MRIPKTKTTKGTLCFFTFLHYLIFVLFSSPLAFPCPVSSSNAFEPTAAMMMDIITTNAFDSSSERSRVFDVVNSKVIGKNAEVEENSSDENSCGVWFLPSMMNHSCFPSAAVFFVGDCLFCVAVRKMEINDEITFPYFDPLEPFRKRQGIAHSLGFKCQCKRYESFSKSNIRFFIILFLKKFLFPNSCAKFSSQPKLVTLESEFLEKLAKLKIGEDIASDPHLYSALEPLISDYQDKLNAPFSYIIIFRVYFLFQLYF